MANISNNIYCGNNRLHQSLQNGTNVIGTRRRCLRKGIGRGMTMPLDPDYLGDYDPLYIDNFYCGDEKKLPNGYDRFGTLADCLRKGIGVGKRIVATGAGGGVPNGQMNFGERENNNFMMKNLSKIIIIILSTMGFYIILKNKKPKFIQNKKTGKVSLKKLSFISFLFFLLISFIGFNFS